MNKQLNTIIFIVIFLVKQLNGFGQTPNFNNVGSGKINSRYNIPVSSTTSNEDIYTATSEWLNTHPEIFNRMNAEAIQEQLYATSTIGREEVIREFSNKFPVQSLDPSAERMSVRVMTKYVGKANDNIKVMYVQYYLIISVENGQVNCEVADMRYNHFSHRNYKFQRILNWSNSKSLDDVNTFEYLMQNVESNPEFQALNSFLNKDLNKIVSTLSTFLNERVSVSQN
jgi:hypothetical protein